MRNKFGARAAAIGAALCLAFLAPAFAQVGHPLKGSWLGFWGPTQKDQRRLVLLMNWKDLKVDAAGRPQKWVASGKVENLGSWTNRRYSGTYTWGKEQGKFIVTLH